MTRPRPEQAAADFWRAEIDAYERALAIQRAMGDALAPFLDAHVGAVLDAAPAPTDGVPDRGAELAAALAATTIGPDAARRRRGEHNRRFTTR
jgi:hypothetical protein